MSESKSASVVFTNSSLLAQNAQVTADIAKTAAEVAQNQAITAQKTADGKNSVYRGSDPSTVPTAGLKEGDLYFTDNAVYTWTGTAWEKTVSDTTGAEIHAKVEAAMQESQKSVADLKAEVESKVSEIDSNLSATTTDLTNVKTDLEDTKKNLATTANDLKADLSAVSNDLSATKTNLENTKTSLSTTVADLQKQTGQLSGSLETANSKIEYNSQAIAEVKHTAEEISTTVSNLHAGDRNLARGVASSKDWFVFQGFNNFVNYYVDLVTYSLETLKAGDVVTFGITMKNDGVTSGTMYFQQCGDVSVWNRDFGGVSPNVNVTDYVPNGAEKKLTYTIPITTGMLNGNSAYKIQIRTDNVPAGGKLSFRYAFVKKGTLTADWTPAPEDTDQAISKVSQTADAILADLTNAKGDIASVKATANSLQSQITDNKNNISSVKQTADSLTTTVGKMPEQWQQAINDKASAQVHDSNVDMNNLTTAGTYLIKDFSVKNSPISAWFMATVEATADHLRVVQRVKKDDANVAYERSSKEGGWTDWERIATGTDVSSIEQTMDSITTRVTNTEGNVSTLQQTANSLNAYVRGSKGSKTLESILSMDPNNSTIAQVVNGQVVAAINTSSDGSVKIDGKTLHITADTKIENAVIKSAMIDSIDASKITTGELDAEKVTIKNLTADKIASGTLNGVTITGSTFIANSTNAAINGGYYSSYQVTIDNSGLVITAMNQFDSYFTAANWELSVDGNPSLGSRSIKASLLGGSPYIDLEGGDGGDNARTHIDSQGISTGNVWLSGTVQAPTGQFGNWQIQDNRVYAQWGTVYIANRAGSNFDSNGSAGFQVWAGIGLGQNTIYTPSNDLYIQQGQGNPALKTRYSDAGKVNVHCNSIYSLKANTVSSRLSVKTDITPVSYDRALAAVEGTEMYDYRYVSDDSGQHYVSGIIDDINPDPQYHMDEMLINKERTARIDANLVGYHHVVIQKLLERVAALEEKVK